LIAFFVVEQGFHFMKMSSLLDKNRPVEQATIVLFFLRWIVLPLYQQFSLFTLLQVCVKVLACINAIEVLELTLTVLMAILIWGIYIFLLDAGGTAVRGWGLLPLFLLRHLAQL
jgi:hypothetical protein